MARRQSILTLRCAHEGCAEEARYSFASQREHRDSWEYKTYVVKGIPYHCVKHGPDKIILSLDTLKSEWVSPPTRPLEAHPHLDWRGFGSRGVIIGDGFYAAGKEFPVGTRLKVTAEIILPES